MLFIVKLISISFFISVVILKLSIKVSNLKNLFDFPNEKRKLHKLAIPNLGGVSIYTTFFFVVFFLFSPKELNTYHFNIFFCSSSLLFGIGLKDDLIGCSVNKKILIQLLAASIFLFNTNFRIISLHGYFGIFELNYIFSFSISLLFIIFITNAFNLIDGINGLAGTVSIFSILYLSILFFQVNHSAIIFFFLPLIVCISIFLYFNYGNAKIFMGNCGSYFLGFILSIFCLVYFSLPKNSYLEFQQFNSIFSILFFPIFDTIRIFIFRIYLKKSPFFPDTNHLHHLLLKLGFNHKQINLQIQLVTSILFSLCIYFNSISSTLLFFILLLVISLFYTLIFIKLKTRKI